MVGSSGMPGSDPGWSQPLRLAGLGFILPFPHFAMWRMRKKGADSLTALRTIFLSWVQSGVLIVLVLWLVLRDASGEGSLDPPLAVALVCLSGVGGLLMTRLAAQRPLDTSDTEKLAADYRTRFFLRTALAQASLLTGFVCAFVTDRWWMVLVGVPFAAVGFLIAAPTRGNLARTQAKVHRQGSTLDLIEALRESPFNATRAVQP